MTEEQRKEVINALVEWVLDVLKNEAYADSLVSRVPEFVRTLITLSETNH